MQIKKKSLLFNEQAMQIIYQSIHNLHSYTYYSCFLECLFLFLLQHLKFKITAIYDCKFFFA